MADLNLGTLVESSLDAIAILDGDGTIRYESPSVEHILGYKPEELMGKSVLEFLHPDDAQNVAATFETIGADPGQPVSMEVRFLHKDGSWRAVEGVGNNLLDDPGVNGFVVTYRDVTERKRAEEALRESEGRFRALIEHSQDAIAILDANGTIVYESPSVEQVLGYKPEELVGRHPFDFIHHDDHQSILQAFEKSSGTPGRPMRTELRFRHKDGSWRVLEGTGTNLLDNPKVKGIVAYYRDVTDRTLAEAALRESEARYRLLADNITDAIFSLDMNLNAVYISPSVERLHGYTFEELMDMDNMMKMCHPAMKDIEDFSRELFAHLTSGDGEQTWSRAMELELNHKDGHNFWIEAAATLIHDPEVQVPCVVGVARDITKRKEMEQQLKESAERFRALIENSSDVVSILNADGTIRYESPAIERILGYGPEERLGHNPIGYTHPDDRESMGKAFSLMIENPDVVARAEARSRHKDGSWRVVEFIGSNMLDTPAVGGIVINFRDITDRKQMEEAVLEAERRYRAIFENRLQMVYVNNEQGVFLDANDLALERLGYARDDLGKISFQGMLHADDVERAFEAVGDILVKGFMEHPIEIRLITRSGEVVWVETFNIPLELSTDRYVGLGIALEITERKRMEAELKDSGEKLKRYLDGSPDVVVVTDLNGTILYINDAGERLIGYTREEFIGNNFLKLGLLAPDHKSKPKEWIEAGGAEKAYSPDEFELVKKDGTRIFTEVSTLTVCPEGDPAKTEIIAIVRDISERKRMEQTLRESEEQYALVVANVADAVFKYRDGKMTWANDRIEEMLGYTKEELVSNDVNVFVAEDVSLTDVTKDVDAGIKSQGHFHSTIRAKKKDGGSAIVEYTASMVPGKEPPEIVGIARDITERRRAEEERERLTAELAEKNREQEQIIYVTSHDLRSPLVNVQGFSKEVKYSLQEMATILQDSEVPPRVREQLGSILESDIGASLQFIETSISKMDTLLSGLLRLSRLGRAALDFRQLNMNELLSDIQKAFEYRIQEAGVSLQVGDLPPCQGDEVQTNQVFSNLVDNALKYLDPERSGTIRITGEESDGRAVFCVEDNGLGIAPEHQQKIFEIFHRLNPGDTTGEGLGLSIIKKILSRHNGDIWVESQAGAGSKFFVSLPAAE